MSEQQEIFELSEVSSISCVCAQWETEIIFKVSKAKPADSESQRTSDAIKHCPNCGISLYPLDEILRSFQYAYGKAGTSEVKMRLRTAPIKSARTE